MYKGGEDLKSKLAQLREGMGYYDQKINASMLEKSGGSYSQNNSILLPELKSITPQIIKQNVNRKKSVEKAGYPSMVIDGSSPHGGG